MFVCSKVMFVCEVIVCNVCEPNHIGTEGLDGLYANEQAEVYEDIKFYSGGRDIRLILFRTSCLQPAKIPCLLYIL